jgi:hypothetical protein
MARPLPELSRKVRPAQSGREGDGGREGGRGRHEEVKKDECGISINGWEEVTERR